MANTSTTAAAPAKGEGSVVARDEAEAASFPPFDPAHFSSSLIWLALTFGALYLLMSRVALPRVEKILSDRRARIDGDLDAAKSAKMQADAAAAAHAKTLAEARANAQATAQKAREELGGQTDARRKALEVDLATKLAAAEAQIAATKAKAMTNVAGIAHEAAAAIVQHLTGLTPDAASVSAAIADQVKA